jgi:hypothetical protein
MYRYITKTGGEGIIGPITSGKQYGKEEREKGKGKKERKKERGQMKGN